MAHTVQRLLWRTGFKPNQASPPAALHRQMELATQFAALAAYNNDLQALRNEICRVAAEGLRATFGKLLVYRSDERTFLLEAGVGWRSGIVGVARLGADSDTAAGFAWYSGQPVIVNDLVYERRFRVSSLLAEHEIISCINIVVPGAEAAYGVLAVASTEPGRFAAHDVAFLQLLAHSLAAAIHRSALRALYKTQAAQSTRDHEVSLHKLQHRVRNDFQVIYSVVADEARHTTNLAGQMGLTSGSQHIMAFAKFYHHLLSQRDIDEVDLGAYLRSICNKIAHAARLSARGITLNTETARLMMPLDRAVRLAVAVNELVTNAAKHAFSDRPSGRITIELIAKDTAGGCPVVSIADDGCGFSGPRPGGGIGLTFVKHLTHQAGGVLEREDGGGTRWRIRLHS